MQDLKRKKKKLIALSIANVPLLAWSIKKQKQKKYTAGWTHTKASPKHVVSVW